MGGGDVGARDVRPGDAVAGRSIVAEQAGSVIGGSVVGVVLLGALIQLTSPTTAEVAAMLVASVFYGVVWGVMMGRYLRRQWAGLAPPPVTRRVQTPQLSPLFRGVIGAASVGFTAAVVAAATVLVLSDGEDLAESGLLLSLAPGGSFGLAISVALSAGEIRRWERRHGLRLHMRVGAPRIAWTRAHALRRLVAVPLFPGPPDKTQPAGSCS